MQPLKGLTVVTLEHAIAAPFATRQLADLGARVIKIERPGVGDFARGYDQRVRGLASHFVWTNRSKESLTLDVKHPQRGRAAAAADRREGRRGGAEPRARRRGAAGRVATTALTATQARPDRLRHLGLRRRPATRPLPRQEGLRPADPERVGLRLDHRHARRAEQGRRCRSPTSPPACTPTATSWPRCCSAQIDGRGRHIDISMLEAMGEWMGYPLYYAFDGAPPPPRTGAAHATIYPYGPFPTGDGKTRDARPAERARVGAASATRCCSSPRWPPTSASPAMPQRSAAPRRAARASSSRPSPR